MKCSPSQVSLVLCVDNKDEMSRIEPSSQMLFKFAVFILRSKFANQRR